MDNINFLNFIYQNSRMGVLGIEYIQDSIESIELKKTITEQLSDYESICSEAVELLIKYHQKEKDINSMAKVGTYLMAKIKEKNDKNIAKLMIEVSNKGLIEINEKLNLYKNCDKAIIKLANKLLDIEERNIKNLNEYL